VREGENQNRSVEHAVPLSAIFFLSQAHEDKAVPLGQGAASAWMTSMALRYFARPGWKSSHTEDDLTLRARVFHNACVVASKLPSFELGVSLNGRFWDELERVTPI
jgi:SynChlorMet cassette protein ScmC